MSRIATAGPFGLLAAVGSVATFVALAAFSEFSGRGCSELNYSEWQFTNDCMDAAGVVGVAGALATLFWALAVWLFVKTYFSPALPILTVVLAIVLIWYASAIRMNTPWEVDQAARAGVEAPSGAALIMATWGQDRPVLPAPHQVGIELYKSTIGMSVTSKRSLIYHGWITISATLLGFAMGTGFGILLAVGIVHNRAMDASVMPWAIASQTIPILAIAPMIIVVMNALGVQGLVPKAIISAFLCFFPVLVGMVKGLRSPDAAQFDLMKTYSASASKVFWALRLPSSVPYLFASLKVGIAASLVGAIVGEMPTGAVAGLGARLLSGSYYGQTVQIWAALFAAAIVAAGLVAVVGAVEKQTLRRMGYREVAR